MAQTCNLPISDVRPLGANYTVGFQSILAYRVTLYLQNRTQLRSSCNFLEPLRNPKLSFWSVLHSPALGLQTQSSPTRAIRRAEGSSNCRSRKPFSGTSPRLTPIFPFPHSNVTHPWKREGCANTQHPTWASRPPERQAWPEAPGFSVPKEGNRAPSGLCGGLRR